MLPKCWLRWGRALVCAALLCFAPAVLAQTFTADFARPADPPLVKDKFGVYQTPFLTLSHLLASTDSLRAIGVQNFRYEIAWGKPDALDFNQIGGTAAHPVLNFAPLDRLVSRLKGEGVRPLLALTYCPDPLKTRTDWGAWQDMPDNLSAWAGIVQAYVAHLHKADGLIGPDYEVWNEPDTPVPGGKMFFTGDPADYGRLYAATASAVHAGDHDAGVGGPAIAYDLRYVRAIVSMPMDFASIHAYNNYPGQIAGIQAALASRPHVPIYLTEYASFNSFGKTAPISRYPAAERFFRDVNGLLSEPDVVRVYWAQWVDDNLGMVTNDGHPKALFNAFRLYALMPTDRTVVSPATQDKIGAMASSDAHTAAVVLWNEGRTIRTVTMRLQHFPFRQGQLQVYRIDAAHASDIDDAATASLTPTQTKTVGISTVWTGTLPGHSVLFFRASDGAHISPPAPVSGVYVRSDYWFPNRSSPAYADFDPRTFTARLGMGNQPKGSAMIGAEIAHPASRIKVLVTRSGSFAAQDSNSLFALRLDFLNPAGLIDRSVLLHSSLFCSTRNARLPWCKGRSTADLVLPQPALDTGRPFFLNLARLAPPAWNRHQARIRLCFLMQDAGKGSRTRISLTRAGAAP